MNFEFLHDEIETFKKLIIANYKDCILVQVSSPSHIITPEPIPINSVYSLLVIDHNVPHIDQKIVDFIDRDTCNCLYQVSPVEKEIGT